MAAAGGAGGFRSNSRGRGAVGDMVGPRGAKRRGASAAAGVAVRADGPEAARARRIRAGATASRGGPRFAAGDAALTRAAGGPGADRGRPRALAYAEGRVPDSQPARALPQSALRTGGVRHERALTDADGLAGGRLHRDPWHRPARA